MKQAYPIFIRIFICLSLVVLAAMWAMRLMDSLYSYRSPLHANPPQPGKALLPAEAPSYTRRVVVVLVDALRVDTASNPSVMPILGELREQAAWATMHSRPPSYSDPGYTVLFTGAWPELNDGPVMNAEYEDTLTWTQDNLFSAANRRGLKTAVSAYYWFEKLIPQEVVNDSFYTPDYDQAADRQVVDAALPWLRSLDYQLVFIHLDQIDTAGHYEGGPVDERWNQAARRVDGLIAELLAEFDLSKDTLLVVSDHGQIDRGGHGGDEAIALQEPFILAGAGVKPGAYGDINMADVAPTLAVLLGTNIPASNQGRVLTEMLDLPAFSQADRSSALVEQQRTLLGAYLYSIGAPLNPDVSGDTVEAYQAALEGARDRKLTSERLPRFAVAAVLSILPLAWFIRYRRAELRWYLLAGLVYLLIFNLRYVLMDGRTYSLSSVSSPSDIIAYGASSAALSVLVSWLFAASLRRIFRLPPGKSAEWTLDLVLLLIYLLTLPLLASYAMNGFLVSWTLPHFPSMFAGFLSLVQMLAVSVIGIGLAAASYAINWVLTSKRVKTT